MSGPHPEVGDSGDTGDTQQISVAELLARNGTAAAPAGTKRRRRRRGDADAVTVAELTGEIPIIRDDQPDPRRVVAQRPTAPPASPPPAPKSEAPQPEAPQPKAAPEAAPEAGPEVVPEAAPEAAEPKAAESKAAGPKAVYWSEPEPRWPKSDPVARRARGPERSEYPRPLHHTEAADAAGGQSGAEHMNPDPVGHYTDTSLDVMDSEVPEAPSAQAAPDDDSEFASSYLSDDASEHTLFGGQSIADEVARRRGQEQSAALLGGPEPATQPRPRRSGARMAALWRGVVTVLQSMLAVVFGAGLFIAFDQLWRWNSIVALLLSVLVIFGLVAGVRAVRKTEDIASTLIAVAVGALITLGPMALWLSR